METNASLVKQVAVKEYQGGSSGFSFRITKGVRYHTGSTRGRMVVVGSRLQTDDTGLLSVTSQRAVFLGQKKTIECAFAKLVSLNVYEDGITFNVTNRQTATTLQVPKGHGDVVAAIVNAVAQDG